MMYIALALGSGFGLGLLVQYILGTRQLEKTIVSMQYQGFRPVAMPPRPKTFPVDPASEVRES